MDYFNPRSPCGERRASCAAALVCMKNFNPRSPCGERLPLGYIARGHTYISTHAPHAGSDGVGLKPLGILILFQPMLPMRGATTQQASLEPLVQYFNPCSPCGERLRVGCHIIADVAISTHAPHAGSDHV